MWTPARPPSPKGCSTCAVASKRLGRVDHRHRLFGHLCPGAGAGHHHLLQAGGAPSAQRRGHHPAGHPGPCGFLQPRWSAPCRCWTTPSWSSAAPTASKGTPGHPVASCCEQLPHPHLPLCQQNGPERPAGREALLDELQIAAGRWLRGLLSRPGGARLPGAGGHVRRGRFGTSIWTADTSRRTPSPPLIAEEAAIPLLLRLRPEAGRGGGVFGRAGTVAPRCRTTPQAFGARVFKISRDDQGARLT